MTLQEYVEKLPESHRARKEFTKLTEQHAAAEQRLARINDETEDQDETTTEPQVVTVLMAERTANSFEGPSFSAMPPWLSEALAMGWVRELNQGALDYMTWTVVTPSGQVVAVPGDRIRKNIGGEFAVEKKDGE